MNTKGTSLTEIAFAPIVFAPIMIVGFLIYSAWTNAIKNFPYFYAWEFLDVPIRWVVGYYNWMLFDASLFVISFAKSGGWESTALLLVAGFVLVVIFLATLKVAPAKYSGLLLVLLFGPIVSLWLW